jgi:polyphosphate kinase 2 (PPK2 family)
VASLKDADLSAKLSASAGVKQLQQAQRRLLALRLQAGGLIGDGSLGPPLCVLFEGWDAAGKGGAIRRLTAGLDPRHVNVATFAAPSPREKRHHFLWRFWPQLPGWGGMTVLDRSWYEEIVSFETGLCEEGMVLVKFWLHISEHEQLRRFRARESDPLKQWKLTDEDWRNHAHRPDYERAVTDMLKKTDHKLAPWKVIAAESKPYARVAVMKEVIRALERGLRKAGHKPLNVDASL